MGIPLQGGYSSHQRVVIALSLVLGLLSACEVQRERGLAEIAADLHFTDPSAQRLSVQQSACVAADSSAARYPLGTGAVVNLPDGGGLILCDSSGRLTSELSSWNLFISDVHIMSAGNAAFVVYSYDTDPVVMQGARIDQTQMVPVWRSEEDTDYSSFLHSSALEVAPDLDTFTQSSAASGTVDFIHDNGLSDERHFSLGWTWDGESYQPDISPSMYPTYEQFLAHIAIESPFERLVQFIEAVRDGDKETAFTCSVEEGVYQEAIHYGLDLENRIFEIVSLADGVIEVRDEMAMLTFEIISVGDRFLIAAVYPTQTGD